MTQRNSFKCLFLAPILMALVSCMYSAKRSEKLLQKARDRKYDIIVVPGIPLQHGKWDSTMKARVYWSKYLFDQGITKNIMYSGSAVYEPYYEGQVMALYAEAIGIPKENIYTETRAEHSTENIYYGYHKSRMLGFKKIALATDPFQAKQLNSFVKLRLDRKVGVIPVVFDTLRMLEPTMIDPVIDLNLAAYRGDFKSLPERESSWKRLKGTMGWNRDKKAYRVAK